VLPGAVCHYCGRPVAEIEIHTNARTGLGPASEWALVQQAGVGLPVAEKQFRSAAA
jgi:hypothetical protein